MGQPVAVELKRTLDPHVVIYETNRWVTGMGQGLYTSASEAPEGSMARKVLEHPGIAAVSVYGSTLTVTKRPDASWEGVAGDIKTALENFYIFYPENIGMRFEATEAEAEA